MNVYPGQGLAIGTAILGNTVGQAYPAGTVFDMCKIYGTLLTPQGEPVGESSTAMATDDEGRPVLVSAWSGQKVVASFTPAADMLGRVIAVAKVEAMTNEYGFFELKVIRGLTVSLTSPAFGISIAVNTIGLETVDISTLI